MLWLPLLAVALCIALALAWEFRRDRVRHHQELDESSRGTTGSDDSAPSGGGGPTVSGHPAGAEADPGERLGAAGPGRANRMRWGEKPAERVGFTAQLMFVEQIEAGCLVDLILLEPPEADWGEIPAPDAGQPIAILLQGDMPDWAPLSVTDLLSQWAKEGAVVGLDMVATPKGVRIDITRADARLSLQLAER